MTEQQLRKKVASIMLNWVGCKESNGSHRQIIDIYNSHKPRARGYKMTYSDPWCAATVSAAFIHAELTDIGFTECSCSKMIELYKAKGRWEEKDTHVPVIGDLIIYDWDDNGIGENVGEPEHVGMVVEVSGNNITVVEGNKDNAVGYRYMRVDGKYIRGYCLPDYANKATDVKVEPLPTQRANTDPAYSFERDYARAYVVTASALNLRKGASVKKAVIKVLPKGSKVTCYGYYTKNGDDIWLYVKDSNGIIGFCSKKYLK